MVTLLLTLLAVGLLLFLMLRHNSGPGETGTDTGNAVHCEPLVNRLVSSTGGIGPEAKAQYDQLPAECKKLLPDPSSLAPTPQQSAGPNPESQ